MLKIDVTPLLEEKSAKLEIESQEDFRSKDFAFKNPSYVKLMLSFSGRGVRVRGSLEGELSLSCGRCLKQFESPVKFQIDEEYISDAMAKTLDPQMTSEEYFMYGPDQVIDLYEMLRQNILLNIPMSPLCKAECRGLCAHCGQDLNEGNCGCSRESPSEQSEDPWAPLQKLLTPPGNS